MKILITGAAGFIGSHLCENLIGKHKIYGLDNFCDFYDPKTKRDNIKKLMDHKDFQLFEIDLRDKSNLALIFSKNDFDMVIHLAAMAGVRPSIEDPYVYTEVNINGTINLLEECKRNDIKKFIFASSSSVYGNNPKVPFSENDNVDFPISPYAATKKAGELICYTYHHLYKISIVALRFFTVYGPRQRPDLAIHKFAKKILNGEPIQIFGDGTSERDYTYIDDIIDGISKAVNFVIKNNDYQIFNLGESKTISLMRMITTIEETLGKKAKKEWLPMQPGDVNRTYADISKSKNLLGYDPKTNFSEGIRKFIEWLKE